MNAETLKRILDDIDAEDDMPPASRCKDEIHITTTYELYGCHLMFLLMLCLTYHCNLKIEALRSLNDERPELIVIIY